MVDFQLWVPVADCGIGKRICSSTILYSIFTITKLLNHIDSIYVYNLKNPEIVTCRKVIRK